MSYLGTPSTLAHSAPTSILSYIWGVAKGGRKVHKMAKTRHGFMIYVVAHKNIESFAYQGFGSWLLHNQVIPKARMTCMPYYWTQMDQWGRFEQEAHSKLSNIGHSEITKQPIAKRWSNDIHWAIGSDLTVKSCARVRRCPTGFWGGQRGFWRFDQISNEHS
jgi:hypothetical protein